jgi:hypothetical protein
MTLTAPSCCSDVCILWLETRYLGIYRGKDHYNDWLFYAAKDVYPADVPRQQALKFMLIIACNPTTIPRDWRDQLKAHGWRTAQARPRPRLACLAAPRGPATWSACLANGDHDLAHQRSECTRLMMSRWFCR